MESATPAVKVKSKVSLMDLGMVGIKVYLCICIPNLSASGKISVQKGEANRRDAH
jgi:hypothetical protein